MHETPIKVLHHKSCQFTKVLTPPEGQATHMHQHSEHMKALCMFSHFVCPHFSSGCYNFSISRSSLLTPSWWVGVNIIKCTTTSGHHLSEPSVIPGNLRLSLCRQLVYAELFFSHVTFGTTQLLWGIRSKVEGGKGTGADREAKVARQCRVKGEVHFRTCVEGGRVLIVRSSETKTDRLETLWFLCSNP